MDGVYKKGDKYVITEIKFGKGQLSKNQKALLCALSQTGAILKPVAGNASQIFLPGELGSNVTSLIDLNINLNGELKPLSSLSDRGFNSTICNTL